MDVSVQFDEPVEMVRQRFLHAVASSPGMIEGTVDGTKMVVRNAHAARRAGYAATFRGDLRGRSESTCEIAGCCHRRMRMKVVNAWLGCATFLIAAVGVWVTLHAGHSYRFPPGVVLGIACVPALAAVVAFCLDVRAFRRDVDKLRSALLRIASGDT